MKKRMLSLVTIMILVIFFTACNNSNTNSNPTAAPEESTQAPNENTEGQDGTTTEPTDNADGQNSDLSGTIVITGSTSVDKILNDMIDEFTALNPDLTINYTGSGSSAGIQDTIDGVNTIGVASREIKEEETKAGAIADIFSYDGIAVAVNPANEVADLTVENLAKIFSGEVTNWNQVGGKDAEIVVVSREGASGTRSAFEELIELEDTSGLIENATVVEGNGNVQLTVAGNENAIGYVSFSFMDGTIKALTIDGIEGTAENTKAGTYPLSRPFLFVINANTLTPEAQAFIDFAKSADGQAFVEEHGGIRID